MKIDTRLTTFRIRHGRFFILDLVKRICDRTDNIIINIIIYLACVTRCVTVMKLIIRCRYKIKKIFSTLSLMRFDVEYSFSVSQTDLVIKLLNILDVLLVILI